MKRQVAERRLSDLKTARASHLRREKASDDLVAALQRHLLQLSGISPTSITDASQEEVSHVASL